MNVIAIFHAYKFTHFSTDAKQRVKPDTLSAAQKAGIVLFGVSNPRPVNTQKPSKRYKNLILQSNKKTQCWYINVENPKGRYCCFMATRAINLTL